MMGSHFGIVQPLLTDFYQLTMSYGYWKAGKANDSAVFEVFFRKNPFSGEFTIFAGLSDCIDYLRGFKFTQEDIDYLKNVMPSSTAPEFFDYLLSLDASKFSLWSVEEGSVVFPREPIMRVEGPVIIGQLLETTLLNLVNFASLITTNAARFRLAAGPNKQLFEFGLRRAQGPDGGLSASRYAYLGGYDGTSNVLAGKMFGIPVVGTHAHSFVSAYQSNSTESSPGENGNGHRTRVAVANHVDNCDSASGEQCDKLQDYSKQPMELDKFLDRCWYWSERLSHLLNYAADQVHPGELAAFANYAVAFPDAFVGLIDTYDVLRSGLPNFCAVTLALSEYGHRAVGLRIDSGDLAFLSLTVRAKFAKIAEYYQLPWFRTLRILVSNDLNEDTLHSLNHQLPSRDSSIDAFCVGTHLVTCQKQPALGCVYKMVEICGNPTMKLSAVADKVTIPGKKTVYRLYSKTGDALLDLLQRSTETPPKVDERILCRHPTEASKRVFVVPAKVDETMKLFWKSGELVRPLLTLQEAREHVNQEMNSLRADYKRFLNPTPYKVSLSEELYNFTYDLWSRMAPIGELS